MHGPRDVLEWGGLEGGGGWPGPTPLPPRVPLWSPPKGGLKILKRKSSWHRRRRSRNVGCQPQTLEGEGGGSGGGVPPLLLRCTAVPIHPWARSLPPGGSAAMPPPPPSSEGDGAAAAHPHKPGQRLMSPVPTVLGGDCLRTVRTGGTLNGGRPWGEAFIGSTPPPHMGHRCVCMTAAGTEQKCKAMVKEDSSSVTCHGRLSRKQNRH